MKKLIIASLIALAGNIFANGKTPDELLQQLKALNRKMDIFFLQYPTDKDLAASGRASEFINLAKAKLEVEDALRSINK